MHPGEIANVFCPEELDMGGTKNLYTDFGAEWVPVHTDMNYVFEVNSCDVTYAEPKPEKVAGPLEPGRCIYLLAQEFESNGKPYAVSVETVDAYAPRVTGVYNVGLSAFPGWDPEAAQKT